MRVAGQPALCARPALAHAAPCSLPSRHPSLHPTPPQSTPAGRDSDGLRDVALAVAAAAKQHLDEARRLRADLAPAARPLFLPAVATGMYLDALERAGFNLLDPGLARAAVAPLPYQLRLKWALLRGGAY